MRHAEILGEILGAGNCQEGQNLYGSKRERRCKAETRILRQQGFRMIPKALFSCPKNGFLSAIPTSLAHMPFCRVMPSNDVGNADIDDTLGDTHDGPNRCVTLSSKGTPACSLIPVQGHVHLTPPASTSSLGNVMLHVYTFLHFFTYLHLFTLFAC